MSNLPPELWAAPPDVDSAPLLNRKSASGVHEYRLAGNLSLTPAYFRKGKDGPFASMPYMSFGSLREPADAEVQQAYKALVQMAQKMSGYNAEDILLSPLDEILAGFAFVPVDVYLVRGVPTEKQGDEYGPEGVAVLYFVSPDDGELTLDGKVLKLKNHTDTSIVPRNPFYYFGSEQLEVERLGQITLTRGLIQPQGRIPLLTDEIVQDAADWPPYK